MPLKTDRRLLAEYAVLLLILVGVPLACAWLGGYDEVLHDVFTIVPQTDDWQSRPEMLWNCRRPFRWWAFFLVGGIGSAMVAPFVVRFLSSLRRVSNSNTQTPKNSNNLQFENIRRPKYLSLLKKIPRKTFLHNNDKNPEKINSTSSPT